MTSNEIRQIVGMKPSDDPKADELRNSNLNHPDEGKDDVTNLNEGFNMPNIQYKEETSDSMTENEYKRNIRDLDKLDKEIDKLESELPKDGELKHYASPYYDPVKAHEYYMKNRELKGRKSTTTLNDEGKAAAEYVKNQLDDERKSKVEALNASTNAQINAKKESIQSTIKGEKENMQNSIETHKNQTINKIKSLREKLEKMTMEEWQDGSESIIKEIEKLRESNATIREKLQSEYSAKANSLREDQVSTSSTLKSTNKAEISRLKEEYDEKYMSELDKIKSNPKYLKSTKRKKSTSK
jgi:hypothetical protein